jgi:hypothetical protein
LLVSEGLVVAPPLSFVCSFFLFYISFVGLAFLASFLCFKKKNVILYLLITLKANFTKHFNFNQLAFQLSAIS